MGRSSRAVTRPVARPVWLAWPAPPARRARSRAGEEVSVKLEAVETRHPQLLYESRVYRSLAGAEGVPAVRWCGVEGDHNARLRRCAPRGRRRPPDAAAVGHGHGSAGPEPRGPLQSVRPPVYAQDRARSRRAAPPASRGRAAPARERKGDGARQSLGAYVGPQPSRPAPGRRRATRAVDRSGERRRFPRRPLCAPGCQARQLPRPAAASPGVSRASPGRSATGAPRRSGAAPRRRRSTRLTLGSRSGTATRDAPAPRAPAPAAAGLSGAQAVAPAHPVPREQEPDGYGAVRAGAESDALRARPEIARD